MNPCTSLEFFPGTRWLNSTFFSKGGNNFIRCDVVYIYIDLFQFMSNFFTAPRDSYPASFQGSDS